MKIALVGLVVATASAGFASFDLMYLPDGLGRVNRYDPVNQVHLGGLNLIVNTRHVGGHVDSPFLIGDLGNTTIYDSVTGGALNNFATTTSGHYSHTTGDKFYGVFGSNIRQFTVSTRSSTLITTAFAPLSLAALPTGEAVVIGINGGGDLACLVYNVAGTLLSNTTLISAASLDPGGPDIGSAAVVSQSNSTSVVFGYRATTSYRLLRANFSGTGITSIVTLGTATAFSTTAQVAVLGGHGGTVWMVGADGGVAAATRIQGYVLSGSTGISNVTNVVTSAFSVPSAGAWSATNIVAPEPNSLLALGAAALLLRRRAKR
ncbi:MAG: hypothetical protein JNJ45_11575 [Chthonomonas sp.]|nr:hypothetical protein [Chthonomonas sp.]